MTFKGAMTALVTPMNEDKTIDVEALEQLVESQITAGIEGLVAMGTTGESATLSLDEHAMVVETVVRASRKRVPVIAGAGSNWTDKAIALARVSAKAGADGLLAVTGYYNKPTQEGLYQHFVACAESTDLPIILYNVPSRTNCDLRNETVFRLAKHSQIVAIKDATGDMRRASQLLDAVGDAISILSGDDFTALPLIALGGHGVISVVSNALPKSMAQMCRAARQGEWAKARDLHFQIMKLTELLFVETNPSPIKKVLALRGEIGPTVRLPLMSPTEPLTAQLSAWVTTQS